MLSKVSSAFQIARVVHVSRSMHMLAAHMVLEGEVRMQVARSWVACEVVDPEVGHVKEDQAADVNFEMLGRSGPAREEHCRGGVVQFP